MKIRTAIISVLSMLLLVSAASAVSYFNITDDIHMNLSNGAYIVLSAGQNFSNSAEPVVVIYNATDSPASTLEINFNSTQARWSNTVNTTLDDVGFSGDNFSFTGTATAGNLAFSHVADDPSKRYDLLVNGLPRSNTLSDITGLVSFVFSSWAQNQNSFLVKDGFVRAWTARAKTDAGDTHAALNTTMMTNLTESISFNSSGFVEFFGALTMPYTALMGNAFYLFVYVLPLVVIWIRQEKALVPVGLSILFGALLLSQLPESWQMPAELFMILTIVGLLYSMFKERG